MDWFTHLPEIPFVTVGDGESSVVQIHAEVVQKAWTKVVLGSVCLLERKLDCWLRANPTQLNWDGRPVCDLEGRIATKGKADQQHPCSPILYRQPLRARRGRPP